MDYATKYRVHDDSDKWLMTTNAQGLMKVFGCHKEAVHRIESEAGPYGMGKPCRLHFNRLTPWATKDYLIYIA